jgi:uncharacterized protein (TIGR00369 family)
MNFDPKDPAWDLKVRDSFHRQSFLQLLGARIEALSPGHCSILIHARPDLCQQHGFLHAGVTATAADTASGYAAFSLMPAGSTVLTAEFKINLLSPAKGSVLVARASIIKPGRTLSTVSCTVHSIDMETETPIASFLGTMMCLQGKDDSR